MILFIIVGATTFSQILTFSGATNGLVAAIQEAQFGPAVVLGVMMLILLVLGCFIDQVSMMLITLPFFMPLVPLYGFDPVWFGVLFLICMQLGLLTPPFGMLLFTMKSVAPALDHDGPGLRRGDALRDAGAGDAAAGGALPRAGHLASRAPDGEVGRSPRAHGNSRAAVETRTGERPPGAPAAGVSREREFARSSRTLRVAWHGTPLALWRRAAGLRLSRGGSI